MKTYKQYIWAIILSFLPSSRLFPQNELLAYVPAGTCNNYINITGSTNLNRFEFRLEFPAYQVFSVDRSDLDTQHQKDIYEIYLPVSSFEADNQLILRDFLTLLKSNHYPEIIIGIGYNQLLDFREGNNGKLQYVRITLAGVTRVYPVSFLVNSCSDDLVYINGYKNIRLTDFDIEPPEKFRGLVKVENEVLINFGFVFMFRSET
ncbi:MAG: YceI family protein [Bacteroidales bacterium]|nr:YceI family protein [Bacteroidales bacterium]